MTEQNTQQWLKQWLRCSRTLTILFVLVGLVGCGGSGGGGATPSPPQPVSDSTAPVITLSGAASIELTTGDTFSDPGASANDAVDGSVSVVTSGSVDTGSAGSYEISYSATDAAGNQATVIRTVVVKDSPEDTTPPTVSLNGDATVALRVGEGYTELGATALDAVDGDLEVTISGDVIVSSAGSYPVSYTAVDAAGNQATVTRTVTVSEENAAEAKTLIVFEDGLAGPDWDFGLGAYDQAIDYNTCENDDGAACPSISWALVDDADRGAVLEVSRINNGRDAGLFIKTSGTYDASAFAGGTITFDVQIVSGDPAISMKVDCVYPCSSGEYALGDITIGDWVSVSIEVNQLVAQDLDLTKVDTGIVLWATRFQETVFRVDNIYWVEGPTGGSAEPGPIEPITVDPTEGPTSPLAYDGLELVWAEEFDGTTLDTARWNYEIGTGSGGWGNNELQYYRSENTTVADGLLIIEAKQESFGGRQYTSSRLTTEDKFSFGFGRVDIRALMPRGQGLWPALWMLGSNFSTVGWPQSGEIDIMEMIGGSGREATVHGTAHWNSSAGKADDGGSYKLDGGETLANGYHVFSLEWTPTALKWSIDGIAFHTLALDQSSDLAAFQKQFFFIVNVAVGGNWPGSPNGNTQFPQRMMVDYIRVFQ